MILLMMFHRPCLARDWGILRRRSTGASLQIILASSPLLTIFRLVRVSGRISYGYEDLLPLTVFQIFRIERRKLCARCLAVALKKQ